MDDRHTNGWVDDGVVATPSEESLHRFRASRLLPQRLYRVHSGVDTRRAGQAYFVMDLQGATQNRVRHNNLDTDCRRRSS